MKARIFIFGLFVLLLLGACASGGDTLAEAYGDQVADADFEVYKSKDGKKIVITGYKGSNRVVQLPERISNLPVTEIAANAFKGVGIVNVTISSTISEVGNSAFTGNYLKNLTIPKGIKVIKGSAFSENELTNVTLSDGLNTIEEKVFENNKLTSITFPSSVAYIGTDAFRGNDITEITIGKEVKIRTDVANGFRKFYEENGSKEGTFVYANKQWKAK